MLELRNLDVKGRGQKNLIRFFLETTQPAAFRHIVKGSLDELDKCLVLAIREGIEDFDYELLFQRVSLSPAGVSYKLYLNYADQEEPEWFSDVKLQVLEKELVGISFQFIAIGVDEFTTLRQLWEWRIIYERRSPSGDIMTLLNTEPIKERVIHTPDTVNDGPRFLGEAIPTPLTRAQGGKLEPWLDWYHFKNNKGLKCTFADVAELSGWSEGYIKNVHLIYQAKPDQNMT